MRTQKTYALLDCHSVCHAAKHKTKRLTFSGHRTGVIFGFLRTLLRLQEELRPDVWAFAWDSRESVRREARPEYKADRQEKSAEEMRLNELCIPQFDTIRELVLPTIGFRNVFKVEGFEADDIIAQAVDLGLLEDYFVMVTRDNDLLQMLSDNVEMYDHIKHTHYTKDQFVADWGIQPEQWIIVKAIAGCKTDNVAGIHGIGEKTAAKMLAGQLAEHTKAYKAIMDEDNQRLAQRNVPLVLLPHGDMPPVTVSDHDRFSLRGFGDVCTEYGMKSMLKDEQWQRWKEAFTDGTR